MAEFRPVLGCFGLFLSLEKEKRLYFFDFFEDISSEKLLQF